MPARAEAPSTEPAGVVAAVVAAVADAAVRAPEFALHPLAALATERVAGRGVAAKPLLAAELRAEVVAAVVVVVAAAAVATAGTSSCWGAGRMPAGLIAPGSAREASRVAGCYAITNNFPSTVPKRVFAFKQWSTPEKKLSQ